MDLASTKVLVVGASGALGAALSRALHEAGSTLALAGRTQQPLLDLAGELGQGPILTFEAIDTASCARTVDAAAEELGGLDALVVAIGVAAFGTAEKTDDAVTELLFAVNTQAPIALATAALPHLERARGTLAVVSAILADFPTPGMTSYSASKAALSAWMTALRREQRRSGVTVFDIRPPHMDTGLADRALAGTPPPMPEPTGINLVVDNIVTGIRDEARELGYDRKTGELRLQ